MRAHFANFKSATAQALPFTDPACPNYSGVLSAISVPVSGSLDLYIQIASPQTTDLVYTLSSANISYVVAGDQVEGFLPEVVIPAGATFSNSFTIYGLSVGATTIDANLAGQGVVLSVPVTAWGVTNTSGSTQLLDANNPSASCIDPATSAISQTKVLAGCGVPVKGVASDGVSPLLLLTEAGLGGNACYEITSTGPPNQGTISVTNSPMSSGAASLFYGYSVYTPPDGYGDSTDSRTVSTRFAYTPAGGTTNTSTIDITTTIVRPPVVLIHGVWSKGSIWARSFYREGYYYTTPSTAANYTTYPADYSGTAGRPFDTNKDKLQGFVAEAIKRSRAKQYATTQADIIGHSMGGNLTRLYIALPTYKRADNLMLGDVHRLITLDTPHLGSNFANLIIALHNSTTTPPYPDPALVEKTVTSLTSGDITQGAVCDLAQNSRALTALNIATPLTGQYITGTGGPAPPAYWGGVGGAYSFERALTKRSPPVFGPYQFPQPVVDAFRFQETNDSIVPLSSQQGNALTTPVSFNDLHQHVPAFGGGIMDDSAVAAHSHSSMDP